MTLPRSQVDHLVRRLFDAQRSVAIAAAPLLTAPGKQDSTVLQHIEGLYSNLFAAILEQTGGEETLAAGESGDAPNAVYVRIGIVINGICRHVNALNDDGLTHTTLAKRINCDLERLNSMVSSLTR